MSLYLIARIADQTIAIAADRVESVVEIETVSRVPLRPLTSPVSPHCAAACLR